MPEHSIAELLSAYRSGRLTCEQVITEYRDTIAQWDGEVNAVIALEIMGFAILLALAFYALSRKTALRMALFQRESAELRVLNTRLQREIAERERVQEPEQEREMQ